MNLISTSCQYVVFCVVFWRTKCRSEFPTQMLEILWPWVKIDCDNVVKTVTPEEQGQLCFSTTRPRDWVARAQWRICWSRWGRSLVWMLTTRFQLRCRDKGELWRQRPTFELVSWDDPESRHTIDLVKNNLLPHCSNVLRFIIFTHHLNCPTKSHSSSSEEYLTTAGFYCWSTFVSGHQRWWWSSLHAHCTIQWGLCIELVLLIFRN